MQTDPSKSTEMSVGFSYRERLFFWKAEISVLSFHSTFLNLPKPEAAEIVCWSDMQGEEHYFSSFLF
jgi:hypothetical protein